MVDNNNKTRPKPTDTTAHLAQREHLRPTRGKIGHSLTRLKIKEDLKQVGVHLKLENREEKISVLEWITSDRVSMVL